MRNFGCLIEECLKQGYRVLVFYIPYFNTKERIDQEFNSDNAPNFFNGKFEYYPTDFEALVQDCKNQKVDILIFDEGYALLYEEKQLEILEQLKRAHIKTVSLNDLFDIIMWSPHFCLEPFDKTYYISEFERDLQFKYWKVEKDRYKNKYEIVGSVAWEQFAGKFPIKKNKTVLFLTQSINTVGLWHSLVWGKGNKVIRSLQAINTGRLQYLGDIWLKPSYKTIVESVRRYCDRNNMELVVKDRLKSPSPNYLVNLADRYIAGDDEDYPLCITYQLLLDADICINNYSFGTMEAIIAGCQVICLHAGPIHDFMHRQDQRIWNEFLFNQKKGMPFNFPYCVHNVNYWDLPRQLNEGYFDTEPYLYKMFRNQYIKKFIGDYTNVSQRILKSLEEL